MATTDRPSRQPVLEALFQQRVCFAAAVSRGYIRRVLGAAVGHRVCRGSGRRSRFEIPEFNTHLAYEV
jgi:hypothetical protein